MDTIHIALAFLTSTCEVLVIVLELIIEILRLRGPPDIIHIACLLITSGCDVLLILLDLLLELIRPLRLSSYEVRLLRIGLNDLQETCSLKLLMCTKLPRT